MKYIGEKAIKKLISLIKGDLNKKLDKNQGTANSGKILGVDASGEVAPTDTEVATLVDVPNGIVKGDGSTLSAAVAGTDYMAPPTGGTAGQVLKKTETGTEWADTPQTVTIPETTALLKGDGIGGVTAVTMDATPTQGSTNPVQSGGVYSAFADKVSKSGDTMTGKLTVPQVETGDGNSNFFQCRKFRGEGDASKYYHAIDFGYQNHDRVDFYEYGGIWNFFKNTSGNADGSSLCGKITTNGWEGNAKLTGSPTAPTPGTSDNSTRIATTAFVNSFNSTKLESNGDGSNVTAAFTAASSRTNISTGEKLSVIFGKIAKWFADLGSLAFKSTVSKSDLASDVQTSLGKADSALQSVSKSDVGLGNVANERQYSSANPPPYPVTSVNGKTGVVQINVPIIPTTTSLIKGNGSGGLVAATRGSDYIASGNIVKQTLVAKETTPTENYAINWVYG